MSVTKLSTMSFADFFDKVGLALFPEDWVGTERHQSLVPSPAERRKALVQLARRKSAKTQRVDLQRVVGAGPWESLDPNGKEYFALFEGTRRHQKVASKIRASLSEGHLIAHFEDGEAVPSWLWDTKEFFAAIRFSAINPDGEFPKAPLIPIIFRGADVDSWFAEMGADLGFQGVPSPKSVAKRGGGKRPGKYYPNLVRFIRWTEEHHPQLLDDGTPKAVRDNEIRRLWRLQSRPPLPISRSGLDEAIKRARKDARKVPPT